jgi:AcrR family transcriptional regulator
MPQMNTSPGRPRDPDLDRRVQAAAAEVYVRLGWAGFSIDAVAREARVGKSSIYLRWPDATTLLLDSLESVIDLPYDTDTGSVRGDLLVLARSIMRLLVGEHGDVLLRLSTEARIVPELSPRWAMFVAANTSSTRRIVRRAIARGELPATTKVPLILEALIGALLMRCLATSPSQRGRLAREVNRYTESVVDLVLSSTEKR